MHEEALLRDLRREVASVAQREHAARVVGVKVWVGALSHVTPEHLRRVWPELMEGTCGAGSRLEVETSEDIQHPQAQAVILRSVALPSEEGPCA